MTSKVCFPIIQCLSCISCMLLFRLLSRRHGAALAYTLCLAVTRHVVTLALAHLEASPLAVTALPFLCMFFSRVSHLLPPILYLILIWRWQSIWGSTCQVVSSHCCYVVKMSSTNKVTLMQSGQMLCLMCEGSWAGLSGWTGGSYRLCHFTQFHALFSRF